MPEAGDRFFEKLPDRVPDVYIVVARRHAETLDPCLVIGLLHDRRQLRHILNRTESPSAISIESAVLHLSHTPAIFSIAPTTAATPIRIAVPISSSISGLPAVITSAPP